MSERGIFGLKPDLRLEWRGQGGQNETQKPDHSASLGDSITSSTRIAFSVHTGVMPVERSEQVIAVEIGSTGNGRSPIFNARRQPSTGGTSRMMREYQVRNL